MFFQRSDCHDDYAFILLRELRESQAARLQSIINGTELPLIKDKYVLNKMYKNYINSCIWFYHNFIRDEGLPLIIRVKYFVRYAGHFFMIKTAFGKYSSRILGFFRKYKLGSEAC